MNIVRIKYGKSIKIDRSWKSFEGEAIVDSEKEDLELRVNQLKEFVDKSIL